jgi:alpha-tubulin suppressor-like RCC1 family protein
VWRGVCVCAAPFVVQFKDASPKLVDVVCGNNHTVVMSEEGQLFSWGFGAFTRL